MMLRSSLLTALMIVLLAGLALAETEDFESVTAGTVVAGELPGGGTSAGSDFAGFTLSVTNHGGGPSSLVIFDSSAPTGGDWDLGTPNAAFGGPGQGSGGASGSGVNDMALGNLLVCAENIVDGNNNDLVDDPDDEAGGCTIVFEFVEPVDLESITVVDIDAESVAFEATDEGAMVGGGEGVDLGNNSVQTLDLTSLVSLDRLVVEFSSSGAIAELVFHPASVPNEQKTFGSVKAMFR